jgi:cyclic pyranopterin phosphate synthase
MPEHGLDWLSRKELMSYEEMLRICSLLVNMGIEKIRITGGEPFVRKDIMSFLSSLSKLDGLKELTITTNGVVTAPLIPELKKLGVGSVNLSLDTLDRDRFFAIARRDELPQVLLTLENLLRYNIKVKLNAVIMEGKNTQDIIPLTRLTRELPVSVRFIEEMPFNGEGHQYSGISWNDQRILATILEEYPDLQKLSDPPFSTSRNYQIPGHKGNIGIIAAYSRSFCGTCNRIRITPQGQLKTCLYDNGIVNVKDKLREGYTDDEISRVLLQAFNKKAKDGWEAERNNSDIFQSMAEIGG